ncbi:DUF1853 family protein [Ulvibacterium sp.]|uniref:DUF1853 family protein n=1 Tax=Ulvibacterium sp. TaxID=2665914 RepID=UPI002612B1AD|nr:DUF1853 family protein [Ulvibacterium sp.]
MDQKQFYGFLNTPPLWQNVQFGIQQFTFPKIDLNHFSTQPIPKRIRLGHQMEHVFKQFMAHSDSYEILLHGVPVKRGNRTIGEIDFILMEVQIQKLIHVELTYKFYLIDPEISEPIHRLIGPNRRDMFFTKIEKIKDQQFPLLHSHEGIIALSGKAIDSKKIEHQVCFKAQLFAPYRNTEVHIRPLNQGCIFGYWLRFDDFNTKDFWSNTYYIPFKSEWVVVPHKDVPWSSHHQILMELNLGMLSKNAPMVWMKKPNGQFDKFFVVWW